MGVTWAIAHRAHPESSPGLQAAGDPARAWPRASQSHVPQLSLSKFSKHFLSTYLVCTQLRAVLCSPRGTYRLWS